MLKVYIPSKNGVYNSVDNLLNFPHGKIENVEILVINSLLTLFPQWPVDILSIASVSN